MVGLCQPVIDLLDELQIKRLAPCAMNRNVSFVPFPQHRFNLAAVIIGRFFRDAEHEIS